MNESVYTCIRYLLGKNDYVFNNFLQIKYTKGYYIEWVSNIDIFLHILFYLGIS